MTITATSPPPDLLPRLREDEHVPVPGTLDFDQVLRALNPLQHLPVVGTIYRAPTGEGLSPALRVLGAGVLGGPVGMLSAAVLSAIEEATAGPRESPRHG
ncbi:hypothetical protein [Falsiroseomonas sp. E2-1-a20]|uniref:hypothetical protein n=1 Tax=Falsiroseomonas sp. E2-1-a20 TaxID=3239300 RepID=UPI003F3EBEDE